MLEHVPGIPVETALPASEASESLRRGVSTELLVAEDNQNDYDELPPMVPSRPPNPETQ